MDRVHIRAGVDLSDCPSDRPWGVIRRVINTDDVVSNRVSAAPIRVTSSGIFAAPVDVGTIMEMSISNLPFENRRAASPSL